MITTSSEETKQAASKLLETLKSPDTVGALGVSGATVLLLEGDLGSGKTTFVQGLAEALGVTEHVTSPTFVLMKSYGTKEGSVFRTLVHIDAYRFEEEKEAHVLDLENVFADPSNLVAIEWPEKISSFLPKTAQKITFTFLNDTDREIRGF